MMIKNFRSWAVEQEGVAVWACLPGDRRVRKETSASACQDLVKKVRSHGGHYYRVGRGEVVLPTGIDLQVHLRFPGQGMKETLTGGLQSAFVGGYDTVVTMPNTTPFLDTPELLEAAIADAKQEQRMARVKAHFTGAATTGMQGQDPTNVAGLVKAGAIAITDDGWGVKSPEAQADLFAACAANDVLFMQHAEMPGHKGVATESAFQRRENLPAYPRTAESEMIARDLALLRRHRGARYHVLHVSTRESLKLIAQAKHEGLRVTAEVTPHHLYFSSEDIPPQGNTDESRAFSASFKMNPPLFGANDRAALRAALRSGVIDCVSTDHAPHEWENKGKGWMLAPFGTRGMETALPVLLTLVDEGELASDRLVEVFSTHPRKVLGVEPGSAGLLVVNPRARTTVTKKSLPGISRNTCFLGTELTGKIVHRAQPGIFATM